MGYPKAHLCQEIGYPVKDLLCILRGDLISRYFSSAEHDERKSEWRSDKICNRDEKISGFKGGNHTRKKQKFPIKKQLSAALDFQENYLRVIERRLVSYSIWMTLRMDLGMKGG